MKYCPQCNKQFNEPWLSFCSDDGTPLITQMTPPADPNWDPQIRDTKVKDPSEQETQWFTREPPVAGGWIAPDERPPMAPGAWQPPQPPYQVRTTQPSQALALCSMIVAICGLVFGGCLGPVPGIVAVVLGLMALAQIKKSPDKVGGKPFAMAGVIIGGLTIAFYVLLLLWILAAIAFG
ncbi:MAG TPA: DUF4190 domain-containing protein [Pyrinomonadaceae bacterium]|nr:DUF4190 domain-containing protein [Pyrinomonadaceae bacterium]